MFLTDILMHNRQRCNEKQKKRVRKQVYLTHSGNTCYLLRNKYFPSGTFCLYFSRSNCRCQCFSGKSSDWFVILMYYFS